MNPKSEAAMLARELTTTFLPQRMDDFGYVFARKGERKGKKQEEEKKSETPLKPRTVKNRDRDVMATRCRSLRVTNLSASESKISVPRVLPSRLRRVWRSTRMGLRRFASTGMITDYHQGTLI